MLFEATIAGTRCMCGTSGEMLVLPSFSGFTVDDVRRVDCCMGVAMGERDAGFGRSPGHRRDPSLRTFSDTQLFPGGVRQALHPASVGRGGGECLRQRTLAVYSRTV